jgi:divalent metal cation (Fe/Co/Zn/Cd) transporter
MFKIYNLRKKETGSPFQNRNNSRTTAASRAFILSMSLSMLIGVSELFFWSISKNRLFFIEGFGNLIWLVPDVIMLIMIRLAGRKADFLMHYGYQRIETLTLFLFSLGISIFILNYFYETLVSPPEALNMEYGIPTIVFSLLVIGLLFSLYRYLQVVGKRIQSKIILLDSMVIKADIASAGIILVSGIFQVIVPSLILIQTGLILFVALALFVYCVNECIGAAKELIDANPSFQVMNLTEQIAEEMFEVIFISDHKIRSLGGAIVVEITIETDPEITVREAYRIAGCIEDRIRSSIENVFDVQIRVHPAGAYLAKENFDMNNSGF